MSSLFEITIEPGKSKTYFRFILVIYLITLNLIVYSSLFLIFKIVLIIFLATLFRSDWVHQSPCYKIQKIQLKANEWFLQIKQGRLEQYTQADILFDNILFQLIKFSNLNQNKFIVLFHDQVEQSQLRLFYLKTKKI